LWLSSNYYTKNAPPIHPAYQVTITQSITVI
jgi:hypothetical protein